MNKNHAEQIKKARTYLNLTQIEFASLVGVSPRTVEAWEINRSSPTRTVFLLLNRILKENGFPPVNL